MSTPLFSCRACGAMNAPVRANCVRCGAALQGFEFTDEAAARPRLPELIAATAQRFAIGWNPVRLMQAAFILSVVLIAASISYYLIVVKPRVEAAKLEQRQTELEQRQNEKANAEWVKAGNRLALDSCLYDANKLFGASLEIIRVRPSDELLDYVERNLRRNNDECYRRYPQ